MEILHIDELKYPLGNGSTRPIMAVSNNDYYVVKTLNNVEGNKVLVNELVCYSIAKQLNLSIPDSGVCMIDKNTVVDENINDMDEFTNECYGLGFYSKYIERNTIISSSKMLKLANNYKSIIPQIMLFDHIIYNKDRNKGNLIMTTNKAYKEIFLIDHSHTFNLECIWDSGGLKQKILDKDYNDTYIMEGNAYLYSKFKDAMEISIYEMQPYVSFFKSKLNNNFFINIMNKIPLEWEKNKNELLSLAEYLTYRLDNIEKYISIIVSYNY